MYEFQFRGNETLRERTQIQRIIRRHSVRLCEERDILLRCGYSGMELRTLFVWLPNKIVVSVVPGSVVEE